MRDVFKLMNFNDAHQSFKRELKLFDRVIMLLTKLYLNDGHIPRDFSFKSAGALSDKEGGHSEMNKKKIELTKANIEKLPSDDARPKSSLSETSSNIT
mmetsp:Transcript_22248/g.34433  ORF Transcript_22248/g.34433 Transcript_22248/m.34433 type:complete len:98 (+) Transcript_22248:545-838(+)|eukprot:CAMPEP_0170510448 /NCGR_PEP_ID=MMETSP0208-20121228/65772_1 /TAXON_ID=197538 /ORGANISM="Strombidium inclinatum, Strain S3" /LENGTH=97 /DNA_ID=CAMNT_0010793913 /DNA_START=1351 /DNA_END=1644 /DNA_ORIENTATION=+